MAGVSTQTTNDSNRNIGGSQSGSPAGSGSPSGSTSSSEEIKEYEIIRRVDRPRYVQQRGVMLCFDFNVERVPAVWFNEWNSGSTVTSYFDPEQGNGGRVYFRNNRQVSQIVIFDG